MTEETFVSSGNAITSSLGYSILTGPRGSIDYVDEEGEVQISVDMIADSPGFYVYIDQTIPALSPQSREVVLQRTTAALSSADIEVVVVRNR